MTLTAPRVADPYPTRIAGDPELIDRTDPSVWGDLSTAAGPIDQATLASHHVRGYSVHPDLLSVAEVDAYRDELARLTADARDDERVVRSRSGDVMAIYEVHETSELVAELVCDPRVLDRARQVLGSAVHIHQSRIACLPGFHGEGAYWHSDFEVWHAEDGMPAPRAVSMSVPLTGQQELMAMPGSHRTFVPTPRGVPTQEHLTTLAAAYGIDRVTDAAGSVLMLDANLMQGSADNITPFPRTTISVVFSSVENPLDAPFAGGAPRPTFLANRDTTPLRR
jgi:ectoine hydroxylase